MLRFLLFCLAVVSVRAVCPVGEYPNSTDITICLACTASTDPNCVQVGCTDPTDQQCVSCVAGMQVDTSGVCVTETACDLCNKPNGCPAGQSCCGCGIEGAQGVCKLSVLCSIENCTIGPCSTTTPTCNSAEYLNSNTCVPCPAPPPGCLQRTCTLAGQTCFVCDDTAGYLLTGSTCSQCTSDQWLDRRNLVCVDCQPLDPTCAVRVCTELNYQNPSACDTCADGYYYNAPSANCSPCMNPIASPCASFVCDSTGATSTCKSCDSGYFLDASNTCQQIPGCQSNQYLDATQTCVDCPPLTNCNDRTCAAPDGSGVSCSSCDAGYTFDASSSCTVCASGYSADPSNPGSCVPLCTAGVSYLKGGTCTVCSTCSSGQYVANPCVGTNDISCASCSTCPAGQYLFAVCSQTGADTQCTDCSTCPAGQYVSQVCNATQNTACSDCTQTCGTNTWQQAACSTNADTVCTPCTACTTTQYLVTDCTPLSDTVCQDCMVCPAGQYALNQCNSTVDTICADCTLSCASGQFQTAPCTADTDIVCGDCTATNCPAGQYESSPCNATADRVCSTCLAFPFCAAFSCLDGTTSTCPNCDAGYKLSSDQSSCIAVCTSTQYLDTSGTCQDCVSPCTSTQYEVTACTGSTQRVCMDCPTLTNCAARTCDATSVNCPRCDSGFNLVNGECIDANCPAGKFRNAAGACQDCSTGPCPAKQVLVTQCSSNSDQVCTPCPVLTSPCADYVCTSAVVSSCTTCDPDYELSSSGSGVCVAAGCLETQYKDANNVCQDCPNTDSDSTHCINRACTLDTINNGQCLSCDSGYVLNSDLVCVSAKSNCSPYQYLQDNTCLPCPLSAYCEVASCTTPTNSRCARCEADYVLGGNGCTFFGTPQSCDPCSATALNTECPSGQPICCGCHGVGTCRSECKLGCSPCPAETGTCPRTPHCKSNGSCKDKPEGTCQTCEVGYRLSIEGGYPVACKDDIGCQICDPCGDSNCPAGTNCCCGSCRTTCSETCPLTKCPRPTDEVKAKVTIKNTARTSCDDNIIDGIQSNIESEVIDIIGCWATSTDTGGANGQVSFVHSCQDSNKRQGQSEITTEVSLDGPYAGTEAQLISQNFPSNTTVDDIDVTLESATNEGNDGSGGHRGLSGGAIAGIVIGSIVAVILIAVAAYLIVTKQQEVESV